MSNEEWYRQSTWSLEISQEFERKLSRSRAQKSEYLRIQALTLAETSNQDFAHSAIDLARRFLELKSEGVGVAQMHATIAKAFTTLGNISAAIDAYKLAVDAEYRWPNIRGYYYIDFAWFAATNKLFHLYEDVTLAITKNMQDSDLIFPVNQYRYFAAMALIASDSSDNEKAKLMAEKALAAASKTEGPFKRYSWLGLVKQDTDEILVRIKKIAN